MGKKKKMNVSVTINKKGVQVKGLGFLCKTCNRRFLVLLGHTCVVRFNQRNMKRFGGK